MAQELPQGLCVCVCVCVCDTQSFQQSQSVRYHTSHLYSIVRTAAMLGSLLLAAFPSQHDTKTTYSRPAPTALHSHLPAPTPVQGPLGGRACDSTRRWSDQHDAACWWGCWDKAFRRCCSPRRRRCESASRHQRRAAVLARRFCFSIGGGLWHHRIQDPQGNHLPCGVRRSGTAGGKEASCHIHRCPCTVRMCDPFPKPRRIVRMSRAEECSTQPLWNAQSDSRDNRLGCQYNDG